MTRLAKPEKKAGKGNERREIYANRRIKANQCRSLNSKTPPGGSQAAFRPFSVMSGNLYPSSSRAPLGLLSAQGGHHAQ